MCRKLDLNPNEGLEGGLGGSGGWGLVECARVGERFFCLSRMGLWGALGAGRAFLGGGGKLTDQTLTASHLEGHLQPRSLLAPFSFLPAVNGNIKSHKFKYLTI